MRRYRQRYLRERSLFDRWGRWCEGQWHNSLGLPRVTWLAKLVQYGERLGVMHAVSEYLPPDHADAEAVNEFMQWLKPTCPPMHAALLARHRGICVERKLDPSGRRLGRGSERHYAANLLADGTPAGVQKFRRLCEQGYRLFQERAGEQVKQATHN
jgi:hypothetical protein